MMRSKAITLTLEQKLRVSEISQIPADKQEVMSHNVKLPTVVT
jgi:hypothetical protein